MQAQDYTIKEWKPWVDNETGEVAKDKHGNHKGSVIFEEFASEPVDATFKPPVQTGQKKYGVVAEYTTKTGKTRVGFTRKDRPEAQQSFTPQGKKEYTPRDDSHIRAQWAIGQAVGATAYKPNDEGYFDQVENLAKVFFSMVDKVKGSSESADPKAPQTTHTVEPSMQNSQNSGMTQASTTGASLMTTSKQPARDWSRVGKQDKVEEVPEDDAELQSLLASAATAYANGEEMPEGILR